MKTSLAKRIFKLGARVRNPELFDFVHILKKTDGFSKPERFDYQTKKLFDLLTFTKEHSSYYSSVIPDFTIDNVRAVHKELPIISKQDLLVHSELIQCYDDFSKLIISETSGSTGEPFTFKKNIEWDTWNRASFIRSYSWYGVDPWDKNGYFWGYSLDRNKRRKIEQLDKLQNRFRVFNYNDEEIKLFLHKLKDAVYLHGYSSMIYETAVIGKKLGFSPKDFPKLKMVKGTSEKIFDFYHPVVEDVFGKKIISEYGSAEGGIIAFECPQGNMHINEENVIVEDVDGQAIVTNLNAYSLPIIRYNTGDSIVLNNDYRCSCGREGGIIEEVLGRVGKKIIGNSRNFPSLTLYYVFKNISLDKGLDIQYQGYQDKSGYLEIRVPKVLSDIEKDYIAEECKRYFADELDVHIKDNFDIHTKTHKLKDFISELENH